MVFQFWDGNFHGYFSQWISGMFRISIELWDCMPKILWFGGGWLQIFGSASSLTRILDSRQNGPVSHDRSVGSSCVYPEVSPSDPHLTDTSYGPVNLLPFLPWTAPPLIFVDGKQKPFGITYKRAWLRAAQQRPKKGQQEIRLQAKEAQNIRHWQTSPKVSIANYPLLWQNHI